MILKRQEKDNVIKVMYDSSNILASIYNKETSDLTLIFGKGTQYKYPAVKQTDYNRFELAESQGKVFNSHIKAYAFEKLDDINPADILTEVENMKNAEHKALLTAKQLKIIKLMDNLIHVSTVARVGQGTEAPTQELFTQEQLEPLQVAIAEFITESIKTK